MANLVNVWRMIPINERNDIRKDEALENALSAARVFVGWGAIGNIMTNKLDDTDELEKALKRAYPGENNVNNGIRALMNFAYVMEQGDLVVLIGKTKSAVCVVQGEYDYGDSRPYGLPEGYEHQRQVSLLSREPKDVERVEWQCGGFADSQFVTVRKSRHAIDASAIIKTVL